MTDEEYREYLAALARTHMRPFCRRHMHPEGDELPYAIAKLSSTARFARAVSERSENLDLINAFGKELDSWPVQYVVDELRETGVLSALDEAPDITFAELRRNACQRRVSASDKGSHSGRFRPEPVIHQREPRLAGTR